MIEPHGGRLVDTVIDDGRADDLDTALTDRDVMSLSWSDYHDAINLSTGRYSPLDGFMTQNDFLKVLSDMTLEDGTVWPLPVVLDVDAETADALTPGQTIGLERPDGRLFGTLDVDEVYKHDHENAAEQIFETTDESHPGVAKYFAKDPFLVGGEVAVFDEHTRTDHELLPKESRILFKHNDWDCVVGFQTRNAPHRGHEYIQKAALQQADGLFVQPQLGHKKDGDYRDDVIVSAYQALMDEYFPDNSATLSPYRNRMRYAGPREAVFDALVRKNHGCTQFIVGRDHAGVGDFYDDFDAQQIFDRIREIGIDVLQFHHAFYCHTCDEMTTDRTCPHGDDQRVYPSGSGVRRAFSTGDVPSEKVMRGPVAEVIREYDEPFVTNGEGS
jgi:sulfate adenylyltransferase